MQSSLRSEKKHIPSKEVDMEQDAKQKANESDVIGEMEIRKGTQKQNRKRKMPDIRNKEKK